jgi:hypothetical protein
MEKKWVMVAHTCHPSDIRKHKIGGLQSRPPLGIIRAKRAESMAQAVKYLPNNLEALSSKLQ